MITLKARRILEHDPDTLWDKIHGDKINVVFDDGSEVLSATQIVLSSYCWVYHIAYKDLPLLRKHTIKHYYKNDRPVRNIHVKLLEDIYKLILDAKQIQDPKIIYKLINVMTQTNNKIYNKAYYSSARYTKAWCAKDYINLLHNEKLTQLKDELFGIELSEKVVGDNFSKATALLTDDLKDDTGDVNVASWMASRGLVKPKQLMQNVYGRGYITDTDGFVIDYPILDSYMTGLRTYRSYMIVARENAVAVEATQDELRSASTDSRRMTYAASSKRGIVYSDCGSKDYISLYIETRGHLNILVGSWIYNEDLDIIQRVDKQHTHLIGKTVKVRSQLTCKVKDPSMACNICVGALSESIPEGANLGSDVSKAIHQIIVQHKMSKKHYLDSASSDVRVQDKAFTQLFKTTPSRDIYLRPPVWKTAVGIHITVFTGSNNIMSVYDTDNVHMMTLSRTSTVREFSIKILKKKTTTKIAVNADSGGIKAMFSYPVLEYIHDEYNKGHERVTLVGSAIKVDLSDFDFTKPVFKRPNVTPTDDVANKYLINLYERQASNNPKIARENTDNILETLDAIIEASLDINMEVSLGCIETILSAYISDPESYSIARGFDNTIHGSASDVISNRSLAMLMMLRSQKKTITSPKAYLHTDRDDSILDVVMDPVGMMEKHGISKTCLQDMVERKLNK